MREADGGTETKSAAIFDINGTIVSRDVLLAFVRPLHRAGLLDARRFLRAYGGQLGYLAGSGTGPDEDAAGRIVSSVMAGWSVEAFRSAVRTALPSVDRRFRMTDVLAGHRQAGRTILFVSSMPVEAVAVIGEHLGADDVAGTEVGIADGVFTGELRFLCRGEAKAEAARRLADEHGIDLAASFAYGDGIGDLPLLETVGHPVCVEPDRLLRAEAAARGWEIIDSRPGLGRPAIAAGTAAVVAAAAWAVSRRRT